MKSNKREILHQRRENSSDNLRNQEIETSKPKEEENRNCKNISEIIIDRDKRPIQDRSVVYNRSR